jgi:hypothetical protein
MARGDANRMVTDESSLSCLVDESTGAASMGDAGGWHGEVVVAIE